MNMKKLILSFTLLLLSNLELIARDANSHITLSSSSISESIEGNYLTAWDSRYFLEGRDSLNGDSILSNSIEFTYDRFSVGAWYGVSPEQDYNELQLSFTVSQEIGEVELYAGLAHFRTPFDGGEDNEIGIGGVWTGSPLDLEFGIDAYYSLNLEGFFTNLSVTKTFSLSDNLDLETSVVAGINQDYIADGHDGINHITPAFALNYSFTEAFSLQTHLVYSFAVGRDKSLPGDELLKDFLHGGAGLHWNF